MKLPGSKGFTLLEIIIVIIIVGILASLALPRFFKVIQYAYSAEAFSSMQAVRGAMERCYIQRQGTYSGCDFPDLDIELPDLSPNAHFEYTIPSATQSAYVIHAIRKTRDGGDGTSTIDLSVSDVNITRSGTTIFANIQ